MSYDASNYNAVPPPTAALRRRRAPIACRLCRKRKIKCITAENPPRGRCDRCERKDLQCEFVTVADEEAQLHHSSSTTSSPEQFPRSPPTHFGQHPVAPSSYSASSQLGHVDAWESDRMRYPQEYPLLDNYNYPSHDSSLSLSPAGYPTSTHAQYMQQPLDASSGFHGGDSYMYSTPLDHAAGHHTRAHSGYSSNSDAWPPQMSHNKLNTSPNNGYAYSSHHNHSNSQQCKYCGTSLSQCRCKFRRLAP